jgi:hypothetical protein
MAAMPPAEARRAAGPRSLRLREIATVLGICVGTLEQLRLFPVIRDQTLADLET